MAKSTTSKNTASISKNSTSVIDRLNANLEKNEKIYFWGILILGITLAFMSFNARMSEAHDDSLYIEAGYKYVHEFPNYYYTSNAPMYPMFLALLTIAFGTNLVYFKLFSILFYALGAVIFYKALDKKVSPILKFFVFTYLCINYLILYFASQTFSEAFYMLMQATFFYFFTKYNFGENPITTDIKTDWKKMVSVRLFNDDFNISEKHLNIWYHRYCTFLFGKKRMEKSCFCFRIFWTI
jgi:hypothetical protein